MDNGYATIYEGEPCIILRIYDPEQETQEEHSGDYPDRTVQVMALNIETLDITPVTDDSVSDIRSYGEALEKLGEYSDFRKENNNTLYSCL